MRLSRNQASHLTYDVSIHPGSALEDVEENLRTFTLPLKARFSPDDPFGVGLYLDGEVSKDILEGDRLERFQQLLDQQGLYVFTMNGFAYGPDAREGAGAHIHQPDWQDEERLGYTFRLSTILSKLLPDGLDEGGITTSPLGYKPRTDLGMPANWMVFTLNVVRIVQHLVRLREETGKLIHIDLEPLPDGVLANGTEVADFFENWLLRQGPALLADRAGNNPQLAREQILDHVRVCIDTCHVASGFEDPRELLDRYDALGIKVGKVQLSSALRVVLPEDEVSRKRISNELAALDQPVHQQQVIQRNANGSLTTYRDLAHALAHINDPDAEEWRIDVHIPVFSERFGGFETTRDVTLDILHFSRERNLTNHFEVETATRDVLSANREDPIVDMIGRQLQWVLDNLDR